jgi:DNA end-binding protein Ku
VIDLMEALRASLERKSGKPAKAKEAAPATAAETRKPPKRAQASEPAAATPRKVKNKA